MRTYIFGCFFLLLILLGIHHSVARAEPTPIDRLFVQKIEPLFIEKCGGCHGDSDQEIKGELDMRSLTGLLKGGESGAPAVVPNDTHKSLLVAAIRWEDGLEMPPKENDRLTAEQIGWVEQWIKNGAPWPGADVREQIASINWDDQEATGVTLNTSGGTSKSWTNRSYEIENLWAYQPLWKETTGELQQPGQNPIDVLIEKQLTQANLQPLTSADRHALIRRLTYDLTGLPPTAIEVADFVTDQSDTAYQTVVERLLESPHYGEQFARHWLDVVRYADSAGFSNDFLIPNAWRYRDYVIRSFNKDKPYDQFIREQLAGDELYPDDPESLIAVGFLRMGPWEHTSMSVAIETRQQFLDDITNSVGVTFLGHELRCASCHDHKFDPIPTKDYYSMQAIFAPVQFADRELPFQSYENTKGFQEGDARIAALEEQDGVRSLTSIPQSEWPVPQFDEDTDEKGRDKVRKKRTEILKRERNRFQPYAYSVYSGPDRTYQSNTPLHLMPPENKRMGDAASVHILAGGSLEAPGDQVQPGVMSVVKWSEDPQSGKQHSAEQPSNETLFNVPTTTVGRRAALADWLTHPEHPLVARVIVNRVWQWHFGKGLAGNPNNFGATGKKPTHPELLDYLARYLIKHDWSIKQLNRLIVTSKTYQRASGPIPPQTQQDDPDNQLYSYFTPRRLSAEELRDAMLLVTGELNTEQGGVPARPELNSEVAMQPRHIMGSVAPAYQPSRTPQERNRRTIYAERIRTLRDPLLEVFNQPGLDTSCEQRDASTISPQAFTLLNSDNSFNRALALADRIDQIVACAPPKEKIEAAFRRTLGRLPTEHELAKSLAHYDSMLKLHEAEEPVEKELPKYVIREMVEEMTGLFFFWVEPLDVYENYVPDLQPHEATPATRALAEICLSLLNTNEFVYVY